MSNQNNEKQLNKNSFNGKNIDSIIFLKETPINTTEYYIIAIIQIYSDIADLLLFLISV